MRELARALGKAIGLVLEPKPAAAVHGGSINATHRWETNAGPIFVKVAPADRREMFEAEAAGLDELRRARALRVPRPLGVGDVVVVSGQLDRRDDQPKLRAAQVLWLPEAYEQLLRELVLHLPLEDWPDTSRWTQLRELVMDAPGPMKLRLVCSRVNGGGERSSIELEPADHYGVIWTPEFKTRLETFLHGARYELRATTQIARQKKKAWQQRN